MVARTAGDRYWEWVYIESLEFRKDGSAVLVTGRHSESGPGVNQRPFTGSPALPRRQRERWRRVGEQWQLVEARDL